MTLTVGLFVTCINDVLFPRAAQAAVAVLERLGCRVEFPAGQSCCGQASTNTGYYPEALPAIRSFSEAFDGYDYVVSPGASCVGSVRHQHAMVARACGEEELAIRAEVLAQRTYDLSEFLVRVLETDDVGAVFPHRVTYHSTCHSLRVTRVGDAPLRLLRAVDGLELLPLPDSEQCCGFGGTFSVKNPDVSQAMAADKAAAVASTGAEFLVALDSMCLMNVGGVLVRNRTGIIPISLAEVLASEAPA